MRMVVSLSPDDCGRESSSLSRSIAAISSRRTASESNAGDWNNLWAEGDERDAGVVAGEADISFMGLRTIRGGARKKHTSSPFGPKTPCEVLGSARFLLFLNNETVKSLDFLPPSPFRALSSSSSSLDDSESIPLGMPTLSSSSPKSKNLRQASRHGLLLSRIPLNRLNINARLCIETRGFRSRSMSGTPD